MANNELSIDTKLNTKGLTDDAKELEKTASSTGENIGEKLGDGLKNASSDAKELNDLIINLGDAADEAGKKLEHINLEKVGARITESGDIKDVFKDLDTGELGEMYGDAGTEKFLSFDESGIDFGEIYSSVTEAKTALEGLKATEASAVQSERELNNTVIDTSNAINTGSPALANFGSRIQQAFGNIGTATSNSKMLQNTALQAMSLFTNFGNTAKFAGQQVKNAFKKIGSAAVSGIKKIPSLVGRAASGLVNMGKKAISAFKNIKGGSNSATGGLKGGLKSLLKYGLGIGTVMALANKLRSALTEGFKNLAQVDGGTNKAISSVMSSLTQLKNALATAFAPILTVIAPILSSFIDKLSAVANAVGAVMAKLTGKTTYSKAIKANQDYAKSLDNSSKSAKNSVYAFDELNTVQQNTDSSSSGTTSPSEMYEETEIDDQSSQMADKLKSMWENADFTELGTMLGTKLAEALDKIPWSGIKEKAMKIGKSIATFINGFVEVPDLGNKIGTALGESFNTLSSLISGFLENLHFESIGTFIGDAVNGIADSIDLTLVANNISTGLKGAFNGLTAFLTEVDWQGIGNKISKFIATIDWGGIAISIFTAIGAALASAIELVWGFVQDAVIGIRDYFLEAIEAKNAEFGDGGNHILAGILQGIIDAIVGIGEWIYEHIFQPFIDGFKNAFGIHSPSTVMAEQGSFIMQGLLNGITKHVQPIIDKFVEVKNKIAEKVTAIKDKIAEIMDGIGENGKKAINGFLSGIESFINHLIDGLNTLQNAVNSFLSSLSDKINAFAAATGLSIHTNFAIPTIQHVQLPRLASGTVVPRQSSEFAAILGDNNREAEVVSPLSTIEDAVRNVLGDITLGGGDVYITADGDLDALVRLLKFKLDSENSRVGKSYIKLQTT